MHLDTMEQIRKRVLEDMDLSEENDDARLREKIEEKVWEHGKCHLISLEEEQRYVQEIFCSLRKLDVLEELLQDESVTEIMVNGYQKIFYEKAGRLYTWDKQFAGREKLEDVIQKMVGKNNRVVNEAMPIAGCPIGGWFQSPYRIRADCNRRFLYHYPKVSERTDDHETADRITDTQ